MLQDGDCTAGFAKELLDNGRIDGLDQVVSKSCLLRASAIFVLAPSSQSGNFHAAGPRLLPDGREVSDLKSSVRGPGADMKPTDFGSSRSLPLANCPRCRAAGLSKASKSGTEPLCGSGAVSQIPCSGPASAVRLNKSLNEFNHDGGAADMEEL